MSSEDIDEDRKTDFVKAGGDIIRKLNIKVAFFLFFIGMILFSDVFINGVLIRIDGTVSGECTTTKGTLIQLMVLTVLYIVLDLCVKANLL
jgi:hypothetical protein